VDSVSSYNNSGRRITTRDAIVKTATITIKTMSIGNKQVTLSGFRQLLQEPLLNPETAELRGVPWGWYNYYWGDCTNDHLHLVWQKGDELQRDCVFPHPPRAVQGIAEKARKGAWRAAAYACKYAPAGTFMFSHGESVRCWDRTRGDYQVQTAALIHRATNRRLNIALNAPRLGYDLELRNEIYHLDIIDDSQFHYDNWVSAWESGLEMQTAAWCADERYWHLNQLWLTRYRELEQLDHLFIAV